MVSGLVRPTWVVSGLGVQGVPGWLSARSYSPTGASPGDANPFPRPPPPPRGFPFESRDGLLTLPAIARLNVSNIRVLSDEVLCSSKESCPNIAMLFC